MNNLHYRKTNIEPCVYSVRLIKKLFLLNKLVQSQDRLDFFEIEEAIYYVKKYHSDQKRLSGEPFFTHPLEVAGITAEYIFDTETIVAALLHDVVEDTGSYLSQIELIFGNTVAEIVNALTKISFNLLLSKEETINKINSFKDLQKKATTIKVIDRLHNMRTINYVQSIEKQKKIAKETMQLYIPLAKYANLPLIAQELQYMVIKVLNI